MKPPKRLPINTQDIAAANISMTISQMLMQHLLKAGILKKEDLVPLFRDMLTYYSAPGEKPERKEIRDAIAEFAQKMLDIYDTPPRSEQN